MVHINAILIMIIHIIKRQNMDDGNVQFAMKSLIHVQN